MRDVTSSGGTGSDAISSGGTGRGQTGSGGTGSGRRTPTGDVERSLVDAAVTVLERDGLAALTVRAVAKEAGVAPMGVYNHLDGKDGLLAAVLIRGFDGLRASMLASVHLPPEQRLRELGRSYRRFALDHPVTYSLMFGGGVTVVKDETVSEHGGDAFGVLVEAVETSQRAGVLMAGDPFDMARRIWACVHGAMSLTLAGAGPSADDAEGTYERILDLIEAGLAG